MIKNNKIKFIISSIIILLPMLFGIIVSDKLPNKIATHWNFNGEVDGWSSKNFVIFFIPLFLLALHITGMIITSLDKKSNNQNKKILNIIFFICPAVSLFAGGFSYAHALGYQPQVALFAPIFLGFVFILIGNYLPKTTQNKYMGIKIKWTLENEKNWNATHRFGGKLWVIGGIILILSALLPTLASMITMFSLIIALVLTPIIYSYVYSRKHK